MMNPLRILPRRGATLVAAFSLLLLGSGLQLSYARPGLDEVRGANQIAQILVEGRVDQTPVAKLATRLAQGGKSAIPVLFETLERGRIDILVGERGNSTRAVSQSEREALLAAFGEFAWAEVLAYLDEVEEAEPREATRIIAIHILGEHGTRRDLNTLVSRSSSEDERTPVARPVRGAFGEALGALLERESVSPYELASMTGQAHLSLVPTIIRTLGGRATEENLIGLGELLGVVPDADVLVLAEIGQLGKAIHHPIDEGVRNRVRKYLSSTDSGLLITGTIAVEQLGDDQAVSDLIDLLEHRDPNVRHQALLALKTIASEQLGRDPEAWREWHQSAQTWWKERASTLSQEVLDRNSSVASRAVLELSKHKFFRHELTEPVSRGLEHPSDEVVILSCAALGHLGSPLAARPLIKLLENRDMEIKRAALLALRRLTGADHGEEPEGWIQAGW